MGKILFGLIRPSHRVLASLPFSCSAIISPEFTCRLRGFTICYCPATATSFILLLAADLLLLSTLPFHTVAIAMQHWPFGDFLCRVVGFLGSACSSASAFTLAALAVFRYLIVVKPARAYRLLSPRRVTITAALLWVPACCLAAPQYDRTVGGMYNQNIQ
uniref:G-protein coupled receptors family 1 profile domain-containing protein n=1 Tax=Myripristis murdjan TaxID=586833 RepID=A0A668ATQ2_9TELE